MATTTDTQTKTMSAPMAIIQIDGVTVGKMKNVRLTETFRRGKVTGLGTIVPSELPVLEWSGSLTCSSYVINFNLLTNVSKKGTFRNANSVEEWQNALLMQEDGLEFAILKKVKDGSIDPDTGLLTTKWETFSKVTGAFATREGFDINEGQMSGRDTDFDYLTPVLYNSVV